VTWHIDTVPREGLTTLLATIRRRGGTIACSTPGTDGVRVTWTSPDGDVESESRPLVGRQ
jgi:hypothetical protein